MSIFDTSNRILDSIATGSWTSNMEPGSFNQVISTNLWIVIIMVVLAFILMIYLSAAKHRGVLTKPNVSKDQHKAEMARLINMELEDLYGNMNLRNAIWKKMGNEAVLEGKQTPKMRVTPDDIEFRSQFTMKLIYVFLFKPNLRPDVASGKFGKILLNSHFFTSRTLHHYYAMNIAAQMYFLQIYAMAKKDPRTVHRKERYMKKAGETVLSLAGKFQQATAMQEWWVRNFIKHDRKMDDEMSHLLHLGKIDKERIEHEMDKYSRGGSSHKVFSYEAKMRNLMAREHDHLVRLRDDAIKKAKGIKELISKPGIDAEEKAKLEDFLKHWQQTIARFDAMIDSLCLIKNRDSKRWKAGFNPARHLARIRKHDANTAAEKLLEEESKDTHDTENIHAILQSFTAAKADLIKELDFERKTI